MEEQKLGDDSTKPQSLILYDVIQWKWQSDPDPWKEKDSTKWTWQDYSSEQSSIIEKAFLLNQATADLGDYEIDFNKMLQVKKNDRHRIRRVKRQEPSRFLMEMPEPTIVSSKDQKTINEAFGTVQHFLDYIMKRTPEAYRLYQRLKDLSLESNETQYQNIIEEVVICIEKGAETREKIIKTRMGSQTKDYVSEAKMIINEIKKISRTLGDFLKIILKIYTMESFICYWLNELLRSENWEEINVLTPYLVCLVYTFKLSDYTIKYEEPKGLMDTFLKHVFKEKIYLYRGTALSQKQLSYYSCDKVKYFSWNGVTSTSRDRNTALKFIQLSLNKAKEQNESKVGVLFKIKVDLATIEDCEGMIDVSQNSKYPKEQEVILAPGTVFQLRSADLIENKIHEVRLRVKKKFNEAQDKIDFLGVIQDKAIFEDKAIIEELPSQKSFKILQLLEGNQMIKRLEIRNSGISEHIMEIIENLRVSTNVKKQDFKLIGNTISLSSLRVLAHYYSLENLNDILRDNKIIFQDAVTISKSDDPFQIKNLILSEVTLHRLQKNNQLKAFWTELNSQNQITCIDLSMQNLQILEARDTLMSIGSFDLLESVNLSLPSSRKFFQLLEKKLQPLQGLQKLYLCSQISDKAMIHIKNCLLALIKLKHVSLDFQKCKEISNEGLNCLKDGLQRLISLQHLSLNFDYCSQISDQGLNYLKSGLIPLTSLQHLSLDFDSCSQISDEGLNHLKSGLIPLTSLQHLSLNFKDCKKISDKGLYHLKSGLIPLTSLQNLSLNLRSDDNISDEGVNLLKSGLTPLTSLQHLSLNFQYVKISDEGVNYLKSGLTLLTSLQHLSLNFYYCPDISDRGLNHLKSGLKPLTSLQHLSLNFNACSRITDQGLNHLNSGLKPLTSLQHLSLDFTICYHIENQGLNHLKSGLTTLTSLQYLSLNFDRCFRMPDLKIGLAPLTSLQHLYLNFQGCNMISDEGLNDLKGGLILLISLQHLSLNFTLCPLVSDKGLNHLKNGIIPLTSLRHLSLNFDCCDKISDKGLNHLKSGLTPLTSLQHLYLNLKDCKKISDEGLNRLKNGLKPLASLQHLDLEFQACSISDEGLNHLKSGLIPLTSLHHLSLNFFHCKNISDEGLNDLSNGLASLTFLQHLSVSFGYGKVTNEGKINFTNSLSSIYQLKYFDR